MSDSEYSISELAQKAGVTVRTIRFYIDQGLLPAPQTKGRYTVYSDEYLERLELIRRLKSAFLPLKEIRQRMNSLSGAEVRELLAQVEDEDLSVNAMQVDDELPPPAALKMSRAVKEDDSALDYVSRLINAPASSPVPLPSPRPVPAPAPAPRPEAWERLPVIPGVEVHARQPLSPEDRRRLDLWIEQGRRILKSNF